MGQRRFKKLVVMTGSSGVETKSESVVLVNEDGSDFGGGGNSEAGGTSPKLYQAGLEVKEGDIVFWPAHTDGNDQDVPFTLYSIHSDLTLPEEGTTNDDMVKLVDQDSFSRVMDAVISSVFTQMAQLAARVTALEEAETP